MEAESAQNNGLPCSDKLVFDDKKQADNAAVAIKYQRGTHLKSYRCAYCLYWHLASHYEQ